MADSRGSHWKSQEKSFGLKLQKSWIPKYGGIYHFVEEHELH
jgi:hypothetical protein